MLRQPGGHVAMRIGQSGKLDEKGEGDVSDMLHIKISQVDTNVRH
jgi:hypothetical protein